jgi:hypothetical protein
MRNIPPALTFEQDRFKERVIHAIKIWEMEHKRTYSRSMIEKMLNKLPESFWDLTNPYKNLKP